MNDEPETMRAKACLCGMPLTGAAALIGVCADCVLASTLAENEPRTKQPGYGFNRRARNGEKERR
jgi:hypothetical protein